MKLKVSQRPEAFFELFMESAENIRVTAELLKDLLTDYTDVEMKARRIQEREHMGDEITHSIIRRLNTTFITPMDREDIHLLASSLDDVLDFLMAGACAVQVGTALFADPVLPVRLIDELEAWCRDHAMASHRELVGVALPSRRDRTSVKGVEYRP